MHSQALLPIVVSVVGHRDPLKSGIEKNRHLFKDDLYSLVKAFPDSPIYMLNGLASGMDLIAAEVFLKLCLEHEGGAQHRLIGVLPKPLQEYKTGICKDELNLFETIINSPHTHLLQPDNCMPLRSCDKLKINDCDECYLRQSLFLVEHSSVLFAFTDGENNGKKGGTSYTVQIAKNQISSSSLNSNVVFSDYSPIGIVEYYTARLSSNNLNDAAFPPRYWKQQDLKDDLSGILTGCNKVNLVNRNFTRTLLHYSGNSSLTLWKFIDQAATDHKSRYQHRLLLLLALGLATAMTLVRPGWQIIGLTIIVVSVYYLPLIQFGFRENFIAFRCLAESLLVLEDWFNFGINHNPADLFRTSLHKDLEWVRSVLRSSSINLFVDQGSLRSNVSPEQLSAYQLKIQGQLQWLASSMRKQSRADFRLLIGTGIVYILACSSSLVFLLSNEQTLYKELFDWITESLMALLAISIGFRELMGFREINARYARSIAQIKMRLEELRIACNSSSNNHPDRDKMIRHAVRSIGIEKMDELNDWVSDQLRRSFSP